MYLFVYGTLRRAARHPMHRLLRRHARPAGQAVWTGRLYDVGPYPAAVPSDDPSDRVAGELYRVEESTRDRLLAHLDAYEGAAYRRVRTHVRREDGEEVEAWVYVYVDATEGLERIPSGDYLAR